MKVKIAGNICFGGSSLCLIAIIIQEVIDLSKYLSPTQGIMGHQSGTLLSNLLYAIAYAIPFLIMMLYIYWTKFGDKRNVTDQYIYETQLQTKRDEQYELIRQLKIKLLTI